MNKSVCITVSIPVTQDLLKNLIYKSAVNLKLEGTAHAVGNDTIRIITHGSIDNIDEFIDALYAGYKSNIPEVVEVEPYTKEHNFRGVFRLIE